jgi:hypothetical protein
MDEVAAYFLEKKKEEEKKKATEKSTQSCTAIGCLGFICIAVIVYFVNAPAIKESMERNKQTEREAKAKQEAILNALTEEIQRTRDGYNKITMYMSYQEVIDLVGQPTSQLAESGYGEARTVIFMWRVGPMANFNVTFQNKRVVSKAQFGL